jgi:hypothetical protein
MSDRRTLWSVFLSYLVINRRFEADKSDCDDNQVDLLISDSMDSLLS